MSLRIKDILWLQQSLFPMTFYNPNFVIKPDEEEYSKISVLGVLKDGSWKYSGVSIVFCIFTIDTLEKKIHRRGWIELQYLIEKYGDYSRDD